jgi:hypothetical protein
LIIGTDIFVGFVMNFELQIDAKAGEIEDSWLPVGPYDLS